MTVHAVHVLVASSVKLCENSLEIIYRELNFEAHEAVVPVKLFVLDGAWANLRRHGTAAARGRRVS